MINLWLCKYVDRKLMDDLRQDGNIDVLAHSVAYTSYIASSSNKPANPLYGLTQSELQEFSSELIKWDKRFQDSMTTKLESICVDTKAIAATFAGVIVKLFWHCTNGCLDALVFGTNLSKYSKNKEEKLRVIVGGDYRLTELVGLIWWLAVCERIGGSNIEYILVSPHSNALPVENVDSLLSLISQKNRIEPAVDGLVPDNLRYGNAPVCLLWVGALRYKGGWDKEIRQRIAEPMNIIRLAEQDRSSLFESPCLELSAGSGISTEDLRHMFSHAASVLSEVRPEDGYDKFNLFNSLSSAIEKYFLYGAMPFVLQKIKNTVMKIENKLGSSDVKAVFSVTAPFIESIALHEWAGKRNILPVLLPHSFTSSHEFSVQSYKTSLTFIRSDHIMASAIKNPEVLSKEELISHDLIRSRHSTSQKSDTPVFHPLFLKLRSLPLGQLWRKILYHSINSVSYPLKRKLFFKRMRSRNLKIGYLLNNEIYEFYTALDFNQLFVFIVEISQKIAESSPKKIPTLILRRKPDWTNLNLLSWHIRNIQKKSIPDNLVISPDNVSLEEFGALCDLVFCFQGSSAITELMMTGAPCIFLDDENAPVMLEEHYVVFPEKIVPAMNVKEVISRINADPEWLTNLATDQQKWVFAQMAS